MDMYGDGIDPSVANLPLSNPACNTSACLAFAAAGDESQLVTPWAGQFAYGHWTTWYYLAIIFIAVLWRATGLWNDRADRKAVAKVSTPSLHQKAVAAGRYLAYRRFRGPWWALLELPSFGVLSLLLTTVLFLSVLTFAARPYYRAHEGYGSPPIAIRSGLIAFAGTPILIALAGKANVITLLTGISHEKLNVIHRWVGWMVLALSLVHTIPFVVAPLRDHGYTTLHQEFYGYGPIGATMYSGVPPLAMLVGLVALSVPYVRHRIYQSFYYMHILLAVTYLGLLFWHAANIMDSWAYLWATVALWLASYLARAFWYTRPLNLRNQWLMGAPTTMFKLPGGMTRIEILAPEGFEHTPSQHCFLRFPDISLVDNHPFTIMSAPQARNASANGNGNGKLTDTDSNRQSLVFLARTHAGFTCKLAEYCTSQPDILASAWVDGPYGGVNRPIEQLYDSLVLIAGGSGITACLPWLQHTIDKSITSGKRNLLRIKRVVLHWVMRSDEHFGWITDELRVISDTARQVSLLVEMKFYVTGGAATSRPMTPTADNKEAIATHKTIDIASSQSSSSDLSDLRSQFIYERPRMEELLRRLDDDTGKTFVVGCGPESLRNELSNACADAQAQVLRGNAQEVNMHLEAFGW